MAAEFKIGRLRFNWQGPWTENQVYARDDVVLHQGKAYVCLVPNTASTNFYDDFYASPYPYWDQITDGKTWMGEWQSSQAYALGDIVLFGGAAYYCTEQHTSSTLFKDHEGSWEIYTQFSNWHASWTINTEYDLGDIVRYGGIVYKCTTDHTSAASLTLGLEQNQNLWTVFYSGIDYKGAWQVGYRYKLNDLVKLNGNIYRCTQYHTSNSTFSTSRFVMWLPGQMFDMVWSSGITYQSGDTVVYGGDAYVSKVANNVGNIPSSAFAEWALFNQGYDIRGSWSSGVAYAPGDVVSKHGMLYESVADSTNQDPSVYTTTTSYEATGSSGTTIVLTDTTNIVAGMIVSGPGITLGQKVSVVVDPTTIILDKEPEGQLIDMQLLTFVGVNYTYWKVLIPGYQWASFWADVTAYSVGDIVVWTNGTYSCIRNHTSSGSNTAGAGNRPDQDTEHTYWSLLVAHDLNNSMNTLGDLETFNNNRYQAVPIGEHTQLLSVNGNTPNWRTINVVPAVYYVDSDQGLDRVDYGTTWDQPWKTIKYGCDFIGQGAYFPNATALLKANKGWMITEMYQWMRYQMANTLAPFEPTSLWDPVYTQRDAGYIIDAIIYDMQRGGNSQTVAATLRFFYYGSTNILVNSLVESSIEYFTPSLNFLMGLMQSVVSNLAPENSYQDLNQVGASSKVNQTINNSLLAEGGATVEINSLMSIITTALSTQSTLAIPNSNVGLTAILYVRTGTYNEQLPIIVPENLSVVGDELRSVAIQPVSSIEIFCTQTIGSTNRVVVTSTIGLTDQMPLQFISPYVNNASTTFGGENIVSGQTYYVIGDSINTASSSFQIADAPTITFTGSTLTDSDVITNVSNIRNLQEGMIITGPGMQEGTTVVSFTQAISSIATITISLPATTDTISVSMTATGNVVDLINGTGNMTIYAGDCLKNMFLMRNGTTMRNFSMFGLRGTLTEANQYGFARPTGGCYTSLDPGTGPDDTSVWIIRRSPYMQNITNFGEACVGSKVDGSLHNGGSKSMLHNDYTQVLSDGIGVWITGSGAISECVSVFSYYNYIGHFAEAGGRIRSTNGNSSYGTFGVASEGYDVNETPISGTIDNQSQQVQATVQDAFGTKDELIKLNFGNAGSQYYTPTTNLIKYSNNFVASVWTAVGNITFIKNNIAPTGYTEAWLLTGTSTGQNYLYQNMTVNPAGATYTGLTATTYSGGGAGATFTIIVTSSQYVVASASGGSGYSPVFGNTGSKVKIDGKTLGGQSGTNDLIIDITSVSGSAVLSAAVDNDLSGPVPSGSNQAYTSSIYVYAGTSERVDLQAIFSGTATYTSGITYNTLTHVCTPYSSGSYTAPDGTTIASVTPAYYKAEKTLVPGWYRIWLSVYDPCAINTQLQFRFFPQGTTSPVANTYSIFYAAQCEIANKQFPPSFYLETSATNYTSYANFEIVGAGTGALLSGDETRSGGVFNARVIADSNGITGGSGYITASNNAQAGDPTYIQLAQSDLGVDNYVNMRVFVNSGTGAGQYACISYYNGTANTIDGVLSKSAQVIKESFETLSILSSDSSGNTLAIQSGTDLSKLYVNQRIQFTPTYYTNIVNTTSITSVNVLQAIGGTTNVLRVADTSALSLNMPVKFSGTLFSTLTLEYTYYIVGIDSSTVSFNGTITGTTMAVEDGYVGDIKIGSKLTGGTVAPNTYVINGSGLAWTVSVSQTATCTGAISSLIQISNVIYGDVWQLSSATGSMSMSYPSYMGYLAGPTTNMVVNIPIQFTGVALGGLALGTIYYINDVINSNNFTISTQQLSLTTTSTSDVNNSIAVTDTSSLIPLNPVVFGGSVFDSLITAGTKYYISNIIDGSTFNITDSIINVTVTNTTQGSNYITVNSTAGFVANQPIKFSGNVFGNILAETTYYIATINPDGTTFIVSAFNTGGVAGGPFNLSTASGQMFGRTCPTPYVIAGGTGSMTITSTSNRIIVTGGYGIMNGTFSTSLFGGVTSTALYYVRSIDGYNIQISTTLGGTPKSLNNAVGTMQLGAVGWDHINPGTAAVTSIDNTSVYYIEPRTVFAAPGWSQTSTSSSTVILGGGTRWQAIATGENYFLALPSAGQTGAVSTNGTSWTNMALPVSQAWTSIAYGNNYWVAVGSSSSTAAYSNNDGTGWRTSTLPQITAWSQVAYGNGVFVTIATGTAYAARTTNNGASWTASTLPGSATWVGLSYGSGKFLAIDSNGVSAWSETGETWTSSSLPSYTNILSGVAISNTTGTFTCTASTSVLVVGQTVTISGTNTGSGSINTPSYTNPITFYIIATNGLTSFQLGTSPIGGPITTSPGTPASWTFTVGKSTYSAMTYGNNRFVAVQSGPGQSASYSFDGITWLQSPTYVSGTSIAYGNGAFVTVSSSGTNAYKTDSGYFWEQKTVTGDGYNAIGFGYSSTNVGVFATLAGQSTGSAISAGIKAQGRPTITSSVMTAVTVWEPGSNYSSSPIVTFSDFNISNTSRVTARISNGVLANPTFVNRGSGYNTTSTQITITGNGFADTYQTGYTIIINNLTSLPLVGSNLTIAGNNTIYKVTSATAVYGTAAPFIQANVQISPNMENAVSPAHGTAVQIRQLYSQCRLTNHDFLSIGAGNRESTNYPNVSDETTRIANEAVEANQGRVFFTSTDQSGNFNVGGLFGVEQATGTITLSATQFGLVGLNQLSLGGIAVGSASVVVTQFSTDPTFTANSDSVIPTQRSIKSYLTSRLSQGGADTFTGQLTAGTVITGGAQYLRSTVPNGSIGSSVVVKSKVYLKGTNGYNTSDGAMQALEMFMRSGSHRS